MKLFDKDFAKGVFRVGKQTNEQGQTLKVCLEKREKQDNKILPIFLTERIG
jgi:hypothetical protein